VQYAAWEYPVAFSEITGLAVDDHGTLTINYNRGGKHHEALKKKEFKQSMSEVQAAIEHYYGRYLNAVAYQEAKAARQASETA
jgi:hypothetical protein